MASSCSFIGGHKIRLKSFGALAKCRAYLKSVIQKRELLLPREGV